MNPPPDETSATNPPMTQGNLPTVADTQAGPGLASPDATAHVLESQAEYVGQETVAATRAYDPSSFEAGSEPGSGSPTHLAPPSSGHSTGGSRRGIIGRIEAGQTLYGKYQVLKRLGGGAMGDVWLVRHLILKAERALKVIVPNFAANEVALMRFQREFEIMASLRHEHAVSIYDATLDDEGGYIEMEYVEGQTLFDALTDARAHLPPDHAGPLMPLEWVDRVLEQLCEVLQVAHEKGIVHRDLKPANMMLLGGRKVGKEYLKVLDFGIAKVRDDPENVVNHGQEAEELKTHGFIGTPSYGSPEQAMSQLGIDGRADLYSVGVMLYEFVVGRLPFRGNHWQVMSQHATAAAPCFNEINAKLRPMPEVEYAILRALAKDPAHRPQTARELYEDVHQAILLTVGESSPVIASPRPYRPAEPPLTEFDGRDTAVPGWAKVEQSTLVADPKPEPEETFAPIPEQPKRGFLVVGVSIAVVAAVAVLSVFLVVKLGLWGQTMTEPYPKTDPRILGGSQTSTSSTTVKGNSPSGSWRDYLPPGFDPVVGYSEGANVWPEKIVRRSDQVAFNLMPDSKGIYLPEGYAAEEPSELAGDGWPKAIVRVDNADDKARKTIEALLSTHKTETKARYLRIVCTKGWTMGSNAPFDPNNNETPAHQVILSGYYMAETEVTNDQFDAFLVTMDKGTPAGWRAAMEETKLISPTTVGAHPALAIPRKLAEAYARYAFGQLPTEAQWEYAARSEGQSRRYVWGTAEPSHALANIAGNDTSRSAPVKSFPGDQTVQGVFDLGGNASEWCRDGWQSYKQGNVPESNPCGAVGDPENAEYAFRGAYFGSIADECPTTHRFKWLVNEKETEPPPYLGLRIVIECPDARKPRE